MLAFLCVAASLQAGNIKVCKARGVWELPPTSAPSIEFLWQNVPLAVPGQNSACLLLLVAFCWKSRLRAAGLCVFGSRGQMLSTGKINKALVSTNVLGPFRSDTAKTVPVLFQREKCREISYWGFSSVASTLNPGISARSFGALLHSPARLHLPDWDPKSEAFLKLVWFSKQRNGI